MTDTFRLRLRIATALGIAGALSACQAGSSPATSSSDGPGVTLEGAANPGVASEGAPSEGAANQGVPTEGGPSEVPPPVVAPTSQPTAEQPPATPSGAGIAANGSGANPDTGTAPLVAVPTDEPIDVPARSFCITHERALDYVDGSISGSDVCPGIYVPMDQLPALGLDGEFRNRGNYNYGVLSELSAHRSAEANETICCYELYTLPSRGRPVVHDGAFVLAPSIDRDDWAVRSGDGTASANSADVRWVADRWSEDGAHEHSSVASFAQTALDLMALGATPELIAGCHAAALDEIRHAQICYGIASELLGNDIGPGPLVLPPSGPMGLVELAVAAFVDGCLGETVAALAMQRAVARGPLPTIAEQMQRIAAEETNHALLAWQIVAWALRESREEESQANAVRDALRSTAREMDGALTSSLTPSATSQEAVLPSGSAGTSDAVLRQYGQLPPELFAQIQRETWRDVVVPLIDDLLAAHS